MILYHFCPAHMLSGIKKKGITLGRMPFIKNGEMTFILNCQWLTSNPDFDQEWAKYGSLPYSRTAFRITVNIPKKSRNLLNWMTMCENPSLRQTAEVLNSCGDPEAWYIYRGRIKPGWFRDVIKRGM